MVLYTLPLSQYERRSFLLCNTNSRCMMHIHTYYMYTILLEKEKKYVSNDTKIQFWHKFKDLHIYESTLI